MRRRPNPSLGFFYSPRHTPAPHPAPESPSSVRQPLASKIRDYDLAAPPVPDLADPLRGVRVGHVRRRQASTKRLSLAASPRRAELSASLSQLLPQISTDSLASSATDKVLPVITPRSATFFDSPAATPVPAPAPPPASHKRLRRRPPRLAVGARSRQPPSGRLTYTDPRASHQAPDLDLQQQQTPHAATDDGRSETSAGQSSAAGERTDRQRQAALLSQTISRAMADTRAAHARLVEKMGQSSPHKNAQPQKNAPAHDPAPLLSPVVPLATDIVSATETVRKRAHVALLDRLSNSSITIRTEGAQAVGKMAISLDDHTDVRAKLFELLGDPFVSVRYAAALALAAHHCDDEPVVAVLIECALNGQDADRLQVARHMAQLCVRSRAVIEALLVCQRDSIDPVRFEMERALCMLGAQDLRLLRALVRRLSNKSWNHRLMAAEMLGRINVAEDWILAALQERVIMDWNDQVRRVASKSLDALGTEGQAMRALLETLESHDYDFQCKAARATASLGYTDPAIVQCLMRKLNSDFSGVRMACCMALCQLGIQDDELVRRILHMLAHDSTNKCRSEAARALGVLGRATDQVIYALKNATIHEPDESVRAECKATLTLMLNTKHLPAGIFYISEDTVGARGGGAAAAQPSTLPFGASVLLSGNEDSAVALIMRNLFDESWCVRAQVAADLEVLGSQDPRVLRGLMSILQDDSESYVRAQAAMALGKLGVCNELIVDALIRACGDSEWSVRAQSCRALRLIEPPKTNAALLAVVTSLLEDPDNVVRQEAVRAVRDMALVSPAILNGLIERLQDPDENVRFEVVRTLAGWRDLDESDLMDYLIDLVDDSKMETRREVVRYISAFRVKVRRSLPSLVRRIDDKDRTVRAEACRAAGRLMESQDEDDYVFEGLKVRLDDSDNFVRFEAAKALAGLGYADPRVASSLISRSAEKNWCVRVESVRALGRLKTTEDRVVIVLIDRLLDSNNHVRQEAAKALLAMGIRDRAVNPLLQQLKEKDPAERVSAAATLGGLALPEEEIRDALMQCLTDAEDAVRAEAARALEKLGLRNLTIVEIVGQLESKDEVVRANAAKAMGALAVDDKRVVPLLVERLGDNSWKTRMEAVRTLKEIGTKDETVMQGLIKLIQDKDPRKWIDATIQYGNKQSQEGVALKGRLEDLMGVARAEAISTLATFRPSDPAAMRETIVEQMADEDSLVRTAAAEAIARLASSSDDEPFFVDVLLDRLEDRNATVRTAVVGSLRRIDIQGERQKQRVGPALVRLLDDPDTAVRAEAAKCFGALGTISEAGKMVLAGRLDDVESVVRAEAAKALGELRVREDRIMAPLVARLDDDSYSVRAEVACALGKLGVKMKRVTTSLMSRLADWNDRALRETTVALVALNCKDEDVIRKLSLRFNDRDHLIRAQVARGLGMLGVKNVSAMIALLDHIEDPSELVRAAVVEALGALRVRGEVVVRAILARLEDKFAGVRSAAILALVDIRDRSDPAIQALVARLEDDELEVRQNAKAALDALGVVGVDRGLWGGNQAVAF